MKNHYELLEIAPNAPPDDVKKAFRTQIARYHPDKVQHLGREFQAMAAERAAELTEAYRILSDAGRRADYDAACARTASGPSASVSPPTPAPAPERTAPAAVEPPPPRTPRAAQFEQERAHRDVVVRKATVERLRQAFAQVAGAGYDEATVRGFDFASMPKAKLFGRRKGPVLLGRFVPRVDAASVAHAWADAGPYEAPSGDGVCIVLMSTALAAPSELASAIQEQRRRAFRRGANVTLIPVDSSVWDAHVPTDAPAVAKDLLARLRGGR